MKKNYTIRNARIDDVSEIYELIHSVAQIHANSRTDLFKEDAITISKMTLVERIQKNKYCVKVLEYDGTLVGTVMYKIVYYVKDIKYRDMRVLQIEEIVLKQQYRNLGLGHYLMNDIKSYAKKNDCKYIIANVWDFNEQSKKFFNNNGFLSRSITLEFEV